MKKLVLIILTASVWASDQIPGAEQKRPILLKGGILHTVSGDVLEGYDILFAKGKIISIEKSIMSSPETDVYDIYDKHVVPGYIAPFTQLGLVEIGLVRQTRDYAETGEIQMSGPMSVTILIQS